jgi:hypothetical protein
MSILPVYTREGKFHSAAAGCIFFPPLSHIKDKQMQEGSQMPIPPSPTDQFLQKIDQLLEELREVRRLNERMDKIALFLEDIRLADVIQNYTAPRRLLLTNFLAGLARGLGLTIGTAIVLALLGWVFSKFLSVPIIGDYIRQIMDYVNAYR